MSKDPVQLYISYPQKHSASDMVNWFKGRSSRKLQDEFLQLGKVYWVNSLGKLDMQSLVRGILRMK
ncbi:MAG: transposase [Methylococcaceae bacterium]